MKKFSFWDQSVEFIHYTIGTTYALFYLAVFVLLGMYSSEISVYTGVPIEYIECVQLSLLLMIVASYVIARRVIKRTKQRLVQARLSSQEICHG